MKTCTKCQKTKSLDDFGNKGGRKNARCKSCVNAYYKEYYTDPERYGKHKDRIRKKRHQGQKYGLSAEALAELKGEGNCQICGDVGYAVDHCHDSGKVRGWLCRGCNLALGYFKDDTRLLRSAIEYLNNSKD